MEKYAERTNEQTNKPNKKKKIKIPEKKFL